MENKEELKLVFVNKIGTTHDGRYEYELYYSLTPDLVWAEDFAEQVPSTCMIDDLLPSIDTYHFVRRGVCDNEFKVAQENSCFSMQDCIDGILSLLWIYDEKDGRYYGLAYATQIDVADEFLSSYGMEYTKEQEVNTDTKPDEDNNTDKINDEGNVVNTNEDPLEYNDDEETEDTEDLEKLFNGDF